jgi:hypothetical protein
MIVFNGGRLTAEEITYIRIPKDEIRSWSFCTLENSKGLLGNRVYARLELCIQHPDEVRYLEQGIRR